MKFHVTPVQFRYEALDPLHVPAGKGTNLFRGTLGLALRELSCERQCSDSRTCPALCLYKRLFEGETNASRPSGYQEAPRPFVLRWDDWAEQRIPAGGAVRVALHLFDGSPQTWEMMLRAFGRIGAMGVGPARSKLRLREIVQLGAEADGQALWSRATKGQVRTPMTLQFDLAPTEDAPKRVHVRFITPTEIKQDGRVVWSAEFRPLYSRLLERIRFLMANYSTLEAAPIDSGQLIEAASQVALVREELRPVEIERFSTRTGQSHPLSGFVGEAEYEGDFRQLWPWMQASEWSGVGRQTVWGKGAVRWVGLRRLAFYD